MAVLLALAILVIGALYLFRPVATTSSFGLPLPAMGDNVPWWLRLKGVRDVASGITVLAVLATCPPYACGVVLLALTITPLGDMTLILLARGSAQRALGIHGVTALVMILTALALLNLGQ
ncbi:DUF4267 domain-containing protein [Bacillus sp. NP157]|nr:DUF4267 domain-containing protein [Bacillus sp. NP157]